LQFSWWTIIIYAFFVYWAHWKFTDDEDVDDDDSYPFNVKKNPLGGEVGL